MAPSATGTGTSRTTRAQYFELGLNLLAEDGARAVTIDALCTRLAVTKGSFYHHFQGVRDFMAQLLLYWEHQYGHRLAREALTTTSVRVMIPSPTGCTTRPKAPSGHLPSRTRSPPRCSDGSTRAGRTS